MNIIHTKRLGFRREKLVDKRVLWLIRITENSRHIEVENLRPSNGESKRKHSWELKEVIRNIGPEFLRSTFRQMKSSLGNKHFILPAFLLLHTSKNFFRQLDLLGSMQLRLSLTIYIHFIDDNLTLLLQDSWN